MNRKQAFTLNELLIVIAIIVLMIGLAVPAFNALTGSGSLESAQNQVSAFLGQARTEAIGVQETRGVMFFLDLDTDRINMAQVRVAFTATLPSNNPIHYLDLVPDRDFIALPPGIGLQTIDDPLYPYNATNDRYLGFNNPQTLAAIPQHRVLYGGVILFDGYGRLSTAQYGFHCTNAANSTNISAAGPSGTYSLMGSLFATGGVADAGASGTSARNFTAVLYAAGYTFAGQLGIVLYDRDAYSNSVTGVTTTGRNEDHQIGSASPIGGDEAAREAWLQANADHLLVNRYNGTLFKGQ
jgi:type II secretory pathway pseudopilin PulG